MTGQRFTCTPGGAVLRGRRKLRFLLVGLTLLMLGVAAATWAVGRFWPAVLAFVVSLIPWTAWRMSGDLDPFWLDLESGWLTVQMRRRKERFAVAGAEVRRLAPDEVSHLETLSTSGGVAAGTGGFESHRLGEFDLYASDLANSVVLDLGETRLIVTPDDPEGFLAAVRG